MLRIMHQMLTYFPLKRIESISTAASNLTWELKCHSMFVALATKQNLEIASFIAKMANWTGDNLH